MAMLGTFVLCLVSTVPQGTVLLLKRHPSIQWYDYIVLARNLHYAKLSKEESVASSPGHSQIFNVTRNHRYCRLRKRDWKPLT